MQKFPIGWDLEKKEYINEKRKHILIPGARINNQLYFLEVNGKYIAYMPYERVAVLLNNEEYHFLQENEFLKDLNIPVKLKRFPFYGVLRRFKYRSIKPFRYLTIYLGDECNLNCIYCYARKLRTFKFDEEKLIKFVIEFNNKFNPEYIFFFGNGEPLLYFNTIKEIVKLLGNKKYHITTNGVVKDKNMLKIITYFLKS